MNRKYRITSKFRFTLFATVLIICAFTLITTILGFNNAGGSSMDQYYAVNVSRGDTLWNIAEEYGPENQDIRKTVNEICDLNEISASDLKYGTRILVPAYK